MDTCLWIIHKHQFTIKSSAETLASHPSAVCCVAFSSHPGIYVPLVYLYHLLLFSHVSDHILCAGLCSTYHCRVYIQDLPSSQTHLSIHFVQASPSAPTSLSVPTEVSSVFMLLNPAAFFLVLILLELITYMVVLTGPCWGSHLFWCLFVPLFGLDPSDRSFSVSQIFGSWWFCLW